MPEFVPYACLTPVNLVPVPQIAIQVPGRDSLIMTQAYLEKNGSETGTITLFDRFGDSWTPAGVMGTVDGGHLLDTSVDLDSFGQIHVTVRWPAASDGHDTTYVRLPWTPGKVWSKSEALTHKTTYRDQPKVRDFWQGRLTFGPKTYVFYSTPYVPGGPRKDIKTPIPAYVEVTEGKKVTRIECPHLGRIGNTVDGAPIDGMLEGEGLSLLTKPDGSVHLLLGIATGDKGKRRLWLWTYEIQPASRPELTTTAKEASCLQSQ